MCERVEGGGGNKILKLETVDWNSNGRSLCQDSQMCLLLDMEKNYVGNNIKSFKLKWWEMLLIEEHQQWILSCPISFYLQCVDPENILHCCIFVNQELSATPKWKKVYSTFLEVWWNGPYFRWIFGDMVDWSPGPIVGNYKTEIINCNCEFGCTNCSGIYEE